MASQIADPARVAGLLFRPYEARRRTINRYRGQSREGVGELAQGKLPLGADRLSEVMVPT